MVRNAAVPVANFGGSISMILIMLGLGFGLTNLLLIGIVAFAGLVFFQLVNLPVEFNASSRAKAQLMTLGIVDPHEMGYVNKVLNAAALTYVAATLQAVLTLAYYIFRFAGSHRD
jgi:Zn-dependent membrane protease YugP